MDKVLIFGARNGDYSEDDVIDWILSFGYNFIKITPRSLLAETIDFSDSYLTINDIQIKDSDIKSVWFRKWYLDKEVSQFLSEKGLTVDEYEIKPLLLNETSHISNYLFHFFKNSKWLGNESHKVMNKLIQQKVASSLGLNTPSTFLSSSFFDKMKGMDLITKLIDSTFSLKKGNSIYTSYTVEVDYDKDKNFYPSLIQEKIDKEYEIRSFYCDGEFFSSAIFTQNNDKTLVDLRNYDNNKPSRIVTYKIPDDIESKIKKMFVELKMNIGLIDLIKGKNGKYYFLEINPYGQFGVTSRQCNFNLEKIIAKYLTDEK